MIIVEIFTLTNSPDFIMQTNSAYMLFYECIPQERKEEEEEVKVTEVDEEIPNYKMELSKDLADVSTRMI